jgi:glycine hydroxymethyltransferase
MRRLVMAEAWLDPNPFPRPWLSARAQARESEVLESVDAHDSAAIAGVVDALVDRNRAIHEGECLNLNPASNVMNPRAEAMLARGLSTRASLGHAGEKYEMGLEAIEQIEVLAAGLVRRVFQAQFAELRVGSGAMANLYAFMATCRPGDSIIVPPPTIGGHVTHRSEGAAGLYGLDIHECPADSASFSYDLDALASLASRVRPRLITVGTSLNLVEHPVREIRGIADSVGADVLFDAAHVCGMIAGRRWADPLVNGADLMTMSTYKSLGGPPGGLVLTNRGDLAERIDAIAYPGLTANFDVGKTAALAITMLDWVEHGSNYAAAMTNAAQTLGAHLADRGVPMQIVRGRPTHTHQLAFDATAWGGGHAAALRLRNANLLTSAIGLPGRPEGAGLRLGTPEIVRIGMTDEDMEHLAGVIGAALTGDPRAVAPEVTALRRHFSGPLRYVC